MFGGSAQTSRVAKTYLRLVIISERATPSSFWPCNASQRHLSLILHRSRTQS